MSQYRMHKLLAAGAALASAAVPLVAATPAAHAITCETTWVNNDGGRWDEAANWSAGMVPSFEDDVCILPLQQEFSVLVDSPQAVNSIHIAKGAALLLMGRPASDPLGPSTPEFFSFGNIDNDGGIAVDDSDGTAPDGSITVENGARLRNRGLVFFLGGGGLNGTVVNEGVVRAENALVDNTDSARPLQFTNDGTVTGNLGVIRSEGTILNRGIVEGLTVLATSGPSSVLRHETSDAGSGEIDAHGGTLRLAGLGAIDAYAQSYEPVGSTRIEGNVAPDQTLHLRMSSTSYPLQFTTNVVNDGFVRVYDAATLLRMSGSRTFTNNGTVQVDGSATHKFRGRFVNTGDLNLAARTSLAFDSPVTMGAASVVKLPIATASRYAFLNSTSSIAVHGTLRVSLPSSGFTPATGQAFVLVRASSITGSFTSTSLPALPAGLGWSVEQTATRITARIVAI